MIPKEKAKELIDKFYPSVQWKLGQEDCLDRAKKCALIAVDEILDLNLGLSNCDENNWAIEKFYTEVKQEINKL
jgi:hypothetical protein